MKRYVVLQGSEEKGPYSIDDLRHISLKNTDLVWVEGESRSWARVDKIPELNALLVKPDPALASSIPAPGKKRSWATWVAVLIASFLTGNMIARAYYNQSHNTPLAEATMEEGIVPAHNPATAHYRNALGHETNFVDTAQNRAIHVPKKAKNKFLKNQVSVSTNNYKVGLLGGISDLQLTVVNHSPVSLDRVQVEVDYLKPNGKVIRAENYFFMNVHGQSSKKISIPKNSRGVKVKASVKRIESDEATSTIL